MKIKSTRMHGATLASVTSPRSINTVWIRKPALFSASASSPTTEINAGSALAL